MIVKFSLNCSYKGKTYAKGDVLEKITLEDMDDIWKLNERGFIYPISYEKFTKYKKQLKGKNKEA